MPSPVLHLATGVSICLLDYRAFTTGRAWFVVPVMVASILPDLDVLPGLVIGDPNRFHAGCSHSLGFAAIAATLAAVIVPKQRWRVMAWVFVAWGLHCVLDAFTVDCRPPYGVPLLWPIYTESFHAAQPIFSSFRHGLGGATSGEFLAEVFSMGNLRVAFAEAGTGLLFILLGAIGGWGVAKYASRRRRSECDDNVQNESIKTK